MARQLLVEGQEAKCKMQDAPSSLPPKAPSLSPRACRCHPRVLTHNRLNDERCGKQDYFVRVGLLSCLVRYRMAASQPWISQPALRTLQGSIDTT